MGLGLEASVEIASIRVLGLLNLGSSLDTLQVVHMERVIPKRRQLAIAYRGRRAMLHGVIPVVEGRGACLVGKSGLR